ncbi:MAG TPA: FAD-binding oxidoreductase, partial [Solirubrobacterales bacterium]|nr:FAD-binding oxidoreductase [Solirubrobacterales bacterium]
MLGFGGEPEEAAPFDADAVPRPRLKPPEELGDLFTDDPYERVVRAMGKSYCDVVRGFRGEVPRAPDLVARPRSEVDVEYVLAWAEDAGAAVIPFGGGTSVVGGVDAAAAAGDVATAADAGADAATAADRGERPVITLDMRAMDRVLEVDPVSRAARIEAGATGPRLEEQLREHGLTLRFFPQSFEYSTLGGWIATRAGGHFASGPTHIEDSLESVGAVTPRGRWRSRRLPGSGAGPSPDRMLAGSEGVLGVITDAWLRVLPRPRFKASASVGFGDFPTAAGALRALLQAGLAPANCRVIDPLEAATTGAGDGSSALLLLGFESPELPVGTELAAAIEIARSAGGQIESDAAEQAIHAGTRERDSASDRTAQGDGAAAGNRGDAAGAASAPNSAGAAAAESWRGAFLLAPYLRDTFVACGVLSETFETAITWDRFAEFHATVTETTRRAVAAASAPAATAEPRVTCRITHAYPDGPALYYTVLAPAVRGGEIEQWGEIKAAASEAILAAGGSITHHHAVGRDHRPYYDRQRPDPFAAALRAAKHELDPAAILNPGVLLSS